MAAFLAAFAVFGAFMREVTQRSVIRDGSAAGAPPNAFRLKGEPSEFKRLPADRPTLLVLGSSQAGSVTSGIRGGQVAWEAPGTLIDELAILSAKPNASFVRISLGGILPEEMSVFAGYQIEAVTPPKAVVLELHWESLAHDNVFREAPRHLLQEADFRARFFADLKAAKAAPEFIANLEQRAVQAQAAADREQLKPLGAQLEGPLVSAASQRFPWLSNIKSQTALFRFVFLPIMSLLTEGSTTNVHPVVPAHLNMNRAAVLGLAAFLKYKQVPFLAYWGPRRHDLPPMTKLDGEETELASLRAQLEAMGGTVIDLRDAVPDDQFGWAGDNPDRMHYGLPAHRAVAERILAAGRASGVFDGLGGPP